MLALDDGAMFRVLLAATAVPPAEFETWLANIVARLEQAQPPAPSAGARYTREWRARERAGRILLRVEADEAALAVTLIDRGLGFSTRRVAYSKIGGTTRFEDPSGHRFCLYEPSDDSLTWGSGQKVLAVAARAAAR